VVVAVGDAARIDGQRGYFRGLKAGAFEGCFPATDWPSVFVGEHDRQDARGHGAVGGVR
jgi:hypothetical protein